MQRCASHMKGIAQQIVCNNAQRIGSSSQTLIRNPSILNKIAYGNKDLQLLSMPKARSMFSESIRCFGFGKFYMHGPGRLAYLASIPVVNEKELVQADDEPTFSYPNGPYTTMSNLTWNGIRITVKQMNLPPHQNCSKRLSADLLIAEQEYNSKLRHPNLLLLMAVCQSSDLDQIRLVYERINLGSLYGVLHERRSEFPVLRVEVIVQMLLQITDVLIYLHSRGYIHRAITSHAVQLVLPGIAKLSNFEFMVESVDGGIYSDLSRFPVPPQFYNWLAPEVIRGKFSSVKSDIYSLCTLIQELFTDTVPWEDMDGLAVKELLGAGHCLSVDERVPAPYYDIVRTGMQVKPRNRTMCLQDIRFILRNDIKDLIINQKHAFENVDSDIQSECVNIPVGASTDISSYRRQPEYLEQLEMENTVSRRETEYLEQGQIMYNDDYQYYNMGRRTSFSPKQQSQTNVEADSKISQEIIVLCNSWKTEQITDDGIASRAPEKVFHKDKLSSGYSSWNKPEQHNIPELAETNPIKYGIEQADILQHLNELDVVLEKEIVVTSERQRAGDGLEAEQLQYSDTRYSAVEDTDGHSSAWLETDTEYATEEEDKQNDPTPNRCSKWTVVKDSRSDQDRYGQSSSNSLNRACEEEREIAANVSIQHSVRTCSINIQASKNLVQQACSALDHVKRRCDPGVNSSQKSVEIDKMSDFQPLEKVPCNKPSYDEVDYHKKNEKGNKKFDSDNEGNLVIPISIAPPKRYRPPVYRAEKRNVSGRCRKAAANLPNWTQSQHASTGKDSTNSEVLRTSDTFADGTQTTCSLKNQINEEESDYSSALDESFMHSSTLDESFMSLSEQKVAKVSKGRKDRNRCIIHDQNAEVIPAHKGCISMRIPTEVSQRRYRKQCIYLSGNGEIRTTQSTVPERVKVRRKKETYNFSSSGKTQHQHYKKKQKIKVDQRTGKSNWTDEVAEVVERMTSGYLPVSQEQPKEKGRKNSQNENEEELFRRFANRSQENRELKDYNRYCGISKKVEKHQLDSKLTEHDPLNNVREEMPMESDSSGDLEEIFRSFAGQRESADEKLSESSKEELEERTDLDETFITNRGQRKSYKENLEQFSTSDFAFESSLDVSDEFFTPNLQFVSFSSRNLASTGFSNIQYAQESTTSSEEELEITREVCQQNLDSTKHSFSSDSDAVGGKMVIHKVNVEKSIERDWSGVSKHSFTPLIGVAQATEIGMVTALDYNHRELKGTLDKHEVSMPDIQNISCIPCDGHFADAILLSKTPMSTHMPFNNSTPYSISPGKKLSQSHRLYKTRSEPLLIQTSKNLNTSLWPSCDSSASIPRTFATACDGTSKLESPSTQRETQFSATTEWVAPSVHSIAHSPLGVVKAKLSPVSSPGLKDKNHQFNTIYLVNMEKTLQVPEYNSAAESGELEVHGSKKMHENLLLSEDKQCRKPGDKEGLSQEAEMLLAPSLLSSTLADGQVITFAAYTDNSHDSQCSVDEMNSAFISKGNEGMDITNEMCDNNEQEREKMKQLPFGITSDENVQAYGNEQKERLAPDRQQEVSHGILRLLSDSERSKIQNILEESERAHSTLDDVLEGILESQDQPKQKVNKVSMNRNETAKEEVFRPEQLIQMVPHIEDSALSGKQTKTGEGGVEDSLESRARETNVSFENGVSEESSNRQRVNWSQPHRVIILEPNSS
ncbi:uncharacterized protein LOC103186913 [Callorhinchus milii]|uniref:uncharacterized protein LOC103186913 n=1 Tax=Callorhinchus milii TaxID=7868 RepID=UPI001C3F9B8B|nr:uncharacterized protein LOC103186913 [Callorhinchus milii]